MDSAAVHEVVVEEAVVANLGVAIVVIEEIGLVAAAGRVTGCVHLVVTTTLPTEMNVTDAEHLNRLVLAVKIIVVDLNIIVVEVGVDTIANLE